VSSILDFLVWFLFQFHRIFNIALWTQVVCTPPGSFWIRHWWVDGGAAPPAFILRIIVSLYCLSPEWNINKRLLLAYVSAAFIRSWRNERDRAQVWCAAPRVYGNAPTSEFARRIFDEAEQARAAVKLQKWASERVEPGGSGYREAASFLAWAVII
jgi:hypothetical protein